MRRLLTPAGGTRAWRRLVAVVLVRDRYTCLMLRDGHPCGAPATTANHKVPRVLGGADTLDNLEAACVPCNMGAGARLRGRQGALLVAHHNTVIAIVRALDAAGVAVDATRRVAAVALRGMAHPWRSSDVDAACRYRRARGPLTRL